ncbi:hypothetical protein OAH87_03145 [Marinomonas sp.]|nr:hypothetical protein [Marinomonas sp.]MDB4837444.1 hypothetical protein [Marinomonas sp.]
MPKVSSSDLELIQQLHSLVLQDSQTRHILQSAFESALAIFEDPEYTLPFASYNLPITHFTNQLLEAQKPMVGLCRVFILRAGCKMPKPEIHRNSIQRLMSYKGQGSIFSASPGGVDMTFSEYSIKSPDSESQSFDGCWDIVPENTWHFPVAAPHEDWFTVTFHSASEAEIIDEYWEEDNQ